MHTLRKLVHKIGFDVHRYQEATNKLASISRLNIKTVLDIGANTGQFAKEIMVILPQAQIYSFEPLKECFNKLTIGQRFNFALGDKEGEVEINKSRYSPSSSLLEMSETHKALFPHTREHTKEKIKVKRLDDLDLDLEPEILIKVDVQGFEDKVIGGGIETFKQAIAVIIETSFTELYNGQPTFDDIYQKLRSLGFEYRGMLQQKIDQKTGQVISEDSLFILK